MGTNFNNCPIVKVPDVVNMRVVDAQFMLDKVNLGYYFFDESMGRRANVDPDEIVVSQTPTSADYLCFGYDVMLTVQTPGSPVPTSSPEQIGTTTTVKPKMTPTTTP
jgi:beta-lactam-binding protein with PASTA domain